MSEAKQTAKLALEALEDKKAMDVRILDITHVSTLADYFMIASGSNRNQVQAMADNVEEVLGKAGVHPKQIEGYQSANWILMMLSSTSSMRRTACSTIWRESGETVKS